MLKKAIAMNQNEEIISTTKKERSLLLLKSIGIVLLLNYFFYKSIWAFAPLTIIGYFFFKEEKKNLLRKKRDVAKEQFKELLLLTATGQKAGYSVENAFLSGYEEMQLLYGADSSICRMLRRLIRGKENNIAFSDIWRQIGRQTRIPEVQEFSQVFEIAQKSSGNAASVMEKTADIIIQKIEIEKEITVLLSAKIMEQKIMNIMPFMIMLYVSLTSPGYFDRMYHSIIGVLLMSIGLIVYIIAYIISIHFISIEI